MHPTYKCECLSASYTGRHCEYVASGIVVRQYVSKSFAYVAIIALSMVMGFFIIMDILKYGFGIDPVSKEQENLRRIRALQKSQSRFHRPAMNQVSPSSSNYTMKRTVTQNYWHLVAFCLEKDPI